MECDPHKRLIVAHARTGTLKHVQDIPDTQCPDLHITDKKNEFNVTYDQKIQATEADIDLCMARFAPPPPPPPVLAIVPPLVLNPKPLIAMTNKPNNIFVNKEAFANYSDTSIPENIAILLSMGPKFSPQIYYGRNDFTKLRDAGDTINFAFGNVYDIEKIRLEMRQYIDDFANNQYTQHSSEIKNFFHSALKDSKAFFKAHPNLIATQADKSNCTIVMNRDMYNDKLENLFKDTTTYSNMGKSSSKAAYITQNKALIDELLAAKMIEDKDVGDAKQEEKIANMYAFIKTHKENAPPRPIVNTRGSPGYTAAGIINDILKPAKETNRYNVKNAEHAIANINKKRPLPDEHFVSFDVRSMYTNIPVEKAKLAVRKRQAKLKLTNAQMQLVLKVIHFVCITSTEISFNGTIYKQIRGLRMGSALSPILADFVMEDFLDTAFRTIERPLITLKYVDDILFLIREGYENDLLTHFNQIDDSIKFDMETENEDGTINYLDFTIINGQDRCSTKWYQKTIASGRFLNYLSAHPTSVIINTAITFVYNMYKNSNIEYHEEIHNRAKHMLKINSFPDKMISTIIAKAKDKLILKGIKTPNTSANSSNNLYGLSIPHIPKLSGQIKNILSTQSDRITPSRPIHKLSQEIFNPSKTSTQKNPLEISIIDNVDLTPDNF